MAKFYGAIGFADTTVTAPGVHTEKITEYNYYGDVIRNTRRLQSTEYVNDDVSISNEISIIADPFAYKNFHSMRYVEFMGAKWKVSNVRVQHPRLNLELGGLYNGN